jgi:hypothetical protein
LKDLGKVRFEKREYDLKPKTTSFCFKSRGKQRLRLVKYRTGLFAHSQRSCVRSQHDFEAIILDGGNGRINYSAFACEKTLVD